MKRIVLSAIALHLLLLGGCLPPSQEQLRVELDLEEMKRRLAQVEQGNAEILHGKGGAATQQLESLSRQFAELQAGLDTMRVEFQSINGRLDDLAQDNRQRNDDLSLVRDDLSMQMGALGKRLESLENRPVPQPVVQSPAVQAEKPVSAAQSPEQMYQAALDKIRKEEKYAEGRALLENFSTQYPKHDLSVNALYWIGEALYGEKEYEGAILQFQDVISRFGEHPKAASAMLKQAMAFEALGDSRNARTTMQKLVKIFPLSPEAEKAKGKLEQNPN